MAFGWRLGSKLMPLSLGIASGAGFLKNPAEAALLGYRVNYIPNPSFEESSSGWVGINSPTIERVTSEFNSGSASLKVTNSSASAIQWSERLPFAAGQGVYYVSAYIKLDPTATTANYFIRHLQYESSTSSTTVASGNVGTTSISSGSGWVRISGAITRATAADFFVLRVATSSTTNGDIFYVDSIMIEKSTTLKPYFDGSNGGFWTGTPNSSFSGATPY